MDTYYAADTLAKLQHIELEILDAIDTLCREHGIEWTLAYGSALGAARHKGFIPWDDDIDIGMMRPDYDRFIEVAREHLPDAYSLHVPGEDPTLATTFVKVCKRGTRFVTQEVIDAGFEQGVFVDIVPYDRISSNPRIRNTQKRRCKLLRYMLFLYHSPHVNFIGKSGCVLRVLKMAAAVSHALIHATTTNEALQQKWDKAARLAEAEEGDEYASFHSMHDAVFPERTLTPASEAMMEGRLWPVPGDLVDYLERIYGSDWTELPTPEKRRTHAPLVLNLGEDNEGRT